MSPRHNQENQPTTPADTPISLSPVKLKNSGRNSGGKIAQLDDLTLNEANVSTVPAKRQKHTKSVKAAAQEASPDVARDKPPTNASAPKPRSKPPHGKKGDPSKKVPSVSAPTAQSPTKQPAKTSKSKATPAETTTPQHNRAAPPPKGSSSSRTPVKEAGSRSQQSTRTTTAAATPKSQKQGSSRSPAAVEDTGGLNTDPEVIKELELVRAQLARANRKLDKARAQSSGKKVKIIPADPTPPVSLIPWPAGTLGKHWHLQAAMGLADDKPLYSKILSDVRKLVIKALDPAKGIRKQDPVKLGAIYEVARDKRPLLAQFENDWATAQIIIQYLSNLRKQETSSESEGEGRNRKGGRGAQAEVAGTHKGKPRNSSPGAKNRLRAARAVLHASKNADNSASSSESSDEEDEKDEDEDEEGTDGFTGGQDRVDEEVGGDEEAGEEGGAEEGQEDEEEDEDEEPEMPPAKRRKVAQVLPEGQ